MADYLVVVLEGPDNEGVYATGGYDFVIRTEGQTLHSAILVSVQFVLKLNAIYVPNLDEAILTACSQHRAARTRLGTPLERVDWALKGVEKLDGRWLVRLPQTDQVVLGATG